MPFPADAPSFIADGWLLVFKSGCFCAVALNVFYDTVVVMRFREAAMERSRVVVRVPATSANMGPGFDCLGMALSIWSEVTMERSDK